MKTLIMIVGLACVAVIVLITFLIAVAIILIGGMVSLIIMLPTYILAITYEMLITKPFKAIFKVRK